MKLAALTLLTLACAVNSHTVEVRNCIAPNGKLRVFARSYHSTSEQVSNVGITWAIDGIQTNYSPTGTRSNAQPSGLTDLCEGAVEPTLNDRCSTYGGTGSNWWWFDFDCDTDTYQYITANTVVLVPWNPSTSSCPWYAKEYSNGQKCGSESPTTSPSASPTESPSASPTSSPTMSPTSSPTASPTGNPTGSPSSAPSISTWPTVSPTVSPTTSPTASPTTAPTISPTASPTTSPTSSPSSAPSISASPTVNPTASPTTSPTASPTTSPTISPTASPTNTPTACDPTITCPDDIAVSANKDCGRIVEFPDAIADKELCAEEPIVTQTSGQRSGSAFLEGITTITFKATDPVDSGNFAECSFHITVTDDEDLDANNIDCGGPGVIKPCDTPVKYTPTYTKDNGCPVTSVSVSSSYECEFCNGASKVVDKKADGECKATVTGAEFDLLESGGVGDHISFTATIMDDNGANLDVECTVCVDKAQGGCGDRRYLRELQGKRKGDDNKGNGGGARKFECPADWDIKESSFSCP